MTNEERESIRRWIAPIVRKLEAFMKEAAHDLETANNITAHELIIEEMLRNAGVVRDCLIQLKRAQRASRARNTTPFDNAETEEK